MRQTLLSLILLFVTVSAFAHRGTINGIVIDDETKSPIEFAIVQIEALKVGTTTNLSGAFTLADIDEGEYTLNIAIFGYKTQEVSVKVKNHETSEITISLKSAPIEIKEVVISADQKATLNTISKLDIAIRPVNTAQDILRMVPGLFIAQHAGGGKAEQIFLRGFDCDHGTDVALSVDGMPVNMVSHAHGQGYADLHFVIPELVDRVNVRKGPYTASIGNLATAGAVQFLTKNSLDNSTFTFEKGMYNTNRVLAIMNVLSDKAQASNQNMYVAGEYVFRRGFFENPDNFNRINVFSKYHGEIRKNQFLTAEFSNFTSFWNASGQIPERAVASGLITRLGSIDNSEGGQTSRMNASVTLNSIMPNGGLVKNQVFYSHYKFNLFSNFTFYKNDTINGDEIQQKEDRNIYGYNGSYSINKTVGGIQFNTEVGAQLRMDKMMNTELSNVKRRNIFLRPMALGDIAELNAAAYFDENIDFNKHLRVNAGVRFDAFNFDYNNKLDSTGYHRQNISKGIVNPKLNIYYSVNNQLQFFILSGTGFHSNDTRVVVAQDGKEILPKAYGAEIGTYFKPLSKILLSASFWYLRLQQEFVYVGDESVVEPSGQTQRMGVDVGIRYELLKWLYLDADFNYANPKALGVPEAESRIPLAPTITSIGGLTVQTDNGIKATVRYRYLGHRAANEDYSLTATGYFIADAVLQYTWKRYTLGVSAENMLNTQWKEAQFATESRLLGESAPVEEIHYTPGTPLFIKTKFSISF